MIKLSRMTDYAVLVLETLNRTPDASLSAAGVAALSGLPEPTVAKVLKLMSSGGIINSQRGAGGGYMLARSADQISVFDVITSIDGPLSVTACAVAGDDYVCERDNGCAMQGRWGLVNTAVRRTFQSISLADMLNTQGGCRASN